MLETRTLERKVGVNGIDSWNTLKPMEGVVSINDNDGNDDDDGDDDDDNDGDDNDDM